MSMGVVDLKRMRVDFAELARLQKARGVWSDADALDYGARIKAHVDQDAVSTLRKWQEWIESSLELALADVERRRAIDEMRASDEFRRASLGRMPERVALERALKNSSEGRTHG